MQPNQLLLLTQAETPPYRPGWLGVTLSVSRLGDFVQVTAVTHIPAPVWFDWFIDGIYFGRTIQNTRTFSVSDDQVQVEVLTARSLGDPVPARTPAAARRTLSWIQSPDAAMWYRIDQQSGTSETYAVGGGSWQPVGLVRAVIGQWLYTWETPRLTDLTPYAWRIVPLDAGNNDGTPIVLPAERIVRTPDAPHFSVSLNSTTVTFTP